MATPWRLGPLLLAVIVALPLVVAAAGAWRSWQGVRREARVELTRSADAAAEYGMRVLVAYALAARQVDALIAGLSDAEIVARERELRAELRALVAELPQAENCFILDRHGAPLVASRPLPAPGQPSAADRDFFLEMQRPDAPAVHISRLHASRLDGRAFFAVSRRRSESGNRLPPGSFDGVVNLSVFPDVLAEGLRQFVASPGASILLLREDGGLLAWNAGEPPSAPPALPPGPAGARRRAGTVEGPEGLLHIAATRLEGFPLYALAYRPEAGILPLWWREVLPQFGLGLTASLALLGLGLLVRQHQGQLIAANASLEARVAERTAALREVTDALDLSPSMIADLEGRILHWSAGCERLYGWTREEVLGRRAREVLQTELPPGGMAAIDAAIARDGNWHGELRQRRKDGTPLIVAAQWTYRYDPLTGEPNGFVSTRSDLTALRRVERSVARSEASLRRAQEASGVVAFEIDHHGLVGTDPALPGLFGLPPGAPFDFATMLTKIHPEDVLRVVEEHRRLARQGGAFATEFRVLWPDGSEHWLLSRGEAEADPAAGPLPARIRGVCLDITGRRRAETALAASEERLRLAQEAAGLGIYDYDYVTGKVTWDARMRVLWSLPEGEEVTRRRFVAAIHPEDRGRRRAALRRAMAPEGDGVYQAELRVIGLADGRERWIALSGRLRFDGGRLVRLVGIAMDITDRKAAEARGLLLMREVDHRAKNALAVVQAALRLSRAETPAELVRIVEGRVAALARAQTALAQRRWEGAELRRLVEGELEPFLSPESVGAPRALLIGPALTIPAGAVQPLCMTLHELATNAVKYGALSAPGGLLTVNWRLEPGGRELTLIWRETGGPLIAAAPARRGFGSRVIQQTAEGQLGGRLERLWLADGLRCELTLPLRRQDAPVAVPPPEDDPASRPGSAAGQVPRPPSLVREVRPRSRVLPGQG
ncbi:PAS domain-containing protein [Siccirubricoccus sp. KC 17139]|uniref:histidine kinase n=1 Tax=Siccirubricoccus soli TaxID=2899147 RepID=A0ABT1D4E6_9PROT|nr:PAS domain-containing protein [Siccirubricoccus soli]MCO6416799.1 PAS domain-containing protein [Siccirubricoccus soli]MCP2682934.1 PAS domain-containing protein [Siccirubricoccus soli]